MGSHLQVLIPVSLVFAAFLTPIFNRWFKRMVEPVAVGVTFFNLVYSLLLLFQIYYSQKKVLEYFPGFSWNGKKILPTGEPIGIVIRTDLIGALMLVLVNLVGFLVIIYSLKYITHVVAEKKKGFYYTLFLLMQAGMSGISLTGDIFNLYVFYEVASLSSYALVSIGDDPEAVEATFKYLLMGALGSIFIVFGIGLLYASTGSLNMNYSFYQIQRILHSGPDSFLYSYRYLIFASLGLFTVGFSIKSAFVPVHAWLPDAHSKAPASISAMLSGLVVKVTGVFLIVRFYFSVFGVFNGLYGNIFPMLLLFIGCITSIAGSIFAIAQTNLKRMLAFSTIAQLGYILIGISLFTRDGLTGSLFHMANHTIMKSTLFLSAGAIIYKTGFTEINELKGVGFRMPVTCACFTIAALGVIGIPPASGFFSKWILSIASIEAGKPYIAVIFLIGGLLNAIYYFRVIGKMYFFTKTSESSSAGELGKNGLEENGSEPELPKSMVIPIILLAAAILFFGFGSEILLKIIKSGVDFFWDSY